MSDTPLLSSDENSGPGGKSGASGKSSASAKPVASAKLAVASSVRAADVMPFLLNRPAAERRRDAEAILTVSKLAQGADWLRTGVSGLAGVAKSLLGEWVTDVSDIASAAIDAGTALADAGTSAAYASFSARGSRAINVRAAVLLLRSVGHGILMTFKPVQTALPTCNVLYRRLATAGLHMAAILAIATHGKAGVMQNQKWIAALQDATNVLHAAYTAWQNAVMVLHLGGAKDALAMMQQRCAEEEEEERAVAAQDARPLAGKVRDVASGLLSRARAASSPLTTSAAPSPLTSSAASSAAPSPLTTSAASSAPRATPLSDVTNAWPQGFTVHTPDLLDFDEFDF